MSRARDLADSADKDIAGTLTLDGLDVAGNVSVDGGTIKLDGNYPNGVNNVALGNAALDTASGANGYSVAIGTNALTAMTTGGSNTAVGAGAAPAITSGSNNVALGTDALASATGANFNTVVGSAALYNSTANYNTVMGRQAAYTNTTGEQNVILGGLAFFSNTTGSYNVALGMESLHSNTTGSTNTTVGFRAGYSNATGAGSVFVGRLAGYSSNATGDVRNTFIGHLSGYASTGTANTFIGAGPNGGSGETMTTGSKNTILGAYNGNQGGLDIRTSSNNIVLSDGDGNVGFRLNSNGALLSSGYVLDNQGIYIEGRNTSYGRINYHKVGYTPNAYAARFYNSSDSAVGDIVYGESSTSYNTSSDYRLKENVVDLTGATTRLKQLEPKRFNFIVDADTTVDGFLAHEVQAIVPEAITGTHNEVDADGNPVYQGIDQSKLVPLLVATIKELEARITALENA